MRDFMKKVCYLTRIKDEEKLIPYHLLYYYNMGIRNFYITFNNSNAETRKAVDYFAIKKMDVILYVFEEEGLAYNQVEVFDEMSDFAYSNGHVWQIPSDADEFLVLKKGSLFKLLKKYDSYDYGFINFRWIDYMRTDKDDNDDPNYFTMCKYREPSGRPQSKIIYKWSPGCKHGHGNHLLIAKRVKMDEIGIEQGFFAHFANRSFEQVMKKRIRVGEAFILKYGEDCQKPQALEYRKWQKEGKQYFVDQWERICRERKEHFSRYIYDPIDPKMFIA